MSAKKIIFTKRFLSQMPTTDNRFIRFVLEHADDDPAQLLLSAGRWPGIDVRRAAQVIGARRKVREKIPSWHADPGLEYPDSLPLEQCSSEATALYKQQFVPEGGRIADLTGGLGVDCWFLSRKADEVHYCERKEVLCETARHNFDILEDRPGFRIEIHEGDGLAWLKAQEGHFDLIYLDPARRSKTAKRVYDISDCEPDLLAVKGELLAKASRVLAKISPMADIARTLAQFPETKELHVVASGGEVKELLLLLETGAATADPEIVVADDGRRFRFKPAEEPAAEVRFADRVGAWLFQPSKALRKAGAFRLLSERFGLAKLAPSTHLYTADEAADGFPGKTFTVEEVLDWSKDACRQLQRRFERLEMTALNFPLTTDTLRSRLSIAGGGPRHLFATTLSDKRKILILCKANERTTPKSRNCTTFGNC